ADGQAAAGEASITADQTYTLDLDGIFIDPDTGDADPDRVAGWKVSVNGAASAKATVDEENVYSFSTEEKGEYTLVFTAVDTYNAESTDTYTVTLTVDNAATTYTVSVAVPAGIEPTFYYTEAAEEDTELTAQKNANSYTVTVPTNISVISWRADGMGMSAEVSEENNTLALVKTDYVVKAGEKVDSGATVTVKYGSKSALGSDNSFLLLSTESYTVKAVPGDDYIKNWKEAELKTQSAVDGECVIQLITREIIFTVPCYAELTVAPASSRQGVKPIALEPVKTDGPDYATDTQNYYYELSNGTVYEYRVSVPESYQNADEYVTYVGVFTKTDNTTAITVTEDQIMDGDNGRETIDHALTPRTDKETLDMANVADLYLNINAQGYLKLNQGQTRDILAARTWWATNGGGWAMFTYYFVEPEYTYTVVGLDGKPSTDVISIDERGVITAKGNGTAIVLVSYDAMNVDFEDALYAGCETPTPDGFYGAIWPENTGVFVVSVGAGDSGISTGLTINEDKTRTNKAAGSAIDSEHDVIYFVGSSGAYSFTPGTEGVTVSVANPTIADNVLGFSGFTVLAAEEDGSYNVPLTNGRNIVRIEKDGKAEYQVITAKSVKVSVNGQSLDEVVVAPGSKISVKFDTLYNPVNRMALYNSAAATVYSGISGWDGKTAGGYRGGVGYYFFASSDFCQTVDHFNSAGTDGSSYGNNAISWGDLLTVPEDFSEAEFTLSDGAFSVGGFSKFNFGDHRTAMGQAPSTGGADNIIAFFGRLPDISIPVGTAKGISVTQDPDRLEYNIGDVFDPSGMEVSVVFELADGSEKTRTVTGFTYDTAAFTESGEQSVNISYGGSTASIKVKVSEKELQKIELTANPSKTNYYIGEAFETGGMEVSATYSDGSEETTAIITNYTVSPEVIAKDTSEITISYGSKTCSVPVTVILIESIAVTTAPNKLQYTVGESFDPAGMVVTANYTDGSVYTTTEYDYTPAGELTLADTSISIIYNGDDGVEGLAPASVAITVTAKPDDGEQGDNTPTSPEYDSIVVYMSFVDEGKVIVNDKRITVYDKNRDGKYTIGDAFRALHREYYTYGESGYAEISNATLSGWVSKFWGKSTPTFSYAYNNGWAGSTNQTIKAGDSIAAFNGEDYVFYSDLYTWFDSRNYTVYTDTDNSFTVNGINIMGSNAGTGARYAPAGADVKVYKGGKEVAELGTSVGEDGSFIINFSETGVYTVKVSGTAHYADYREAPVVPCSCAVTVKKAPAQEEKPDDGEKPDGEETIPDSGFEDISGHWGTDAIDYVAYKGIMNGVSEKCFEPNGEVSRAMVATVLYRLAGSPESEGENIFTDVPEGKWYTDAVIWAAENGIVNGYGNGVFAPEKSIARQEMAAMLMRYASFKGMDTESDADLSAYTDSGEIGAWALDAIRWANENGLITGRSGSILAPKDTATRAEMAKILMCFMTMDSYEAE
ncbi:MAG: S-layer homology domain-containing protein, partial [Oscillospiraceae bacterium]|nr:S-layer homology domain-containing protein [Oscillospiraceae bacterium]